MVQYVRVRSVRSAFLPLPADLRPRSPWSSHSHPDPTTTCQDGTQLQFKSALRKTYLTADNGGGGAVVANRTQASDWETFKVRSDNDAGLRLENSSYLINGGSMQLWRLNDTTFNFRTSGNQFVGIGASDGIIVATATTPGLPETFQIVRCPFDKNRVRIKAANGYFVQVNIGSQ